MEKELLRIKVDFDKLLDWKDPERDDLPIISYMSFYRATGILDAVVNYKKEDPECEFAAAVNIVCNTITNRRIRSFIEEIWSVYSLDIDNDNHVFWDTKKYAKGTRHYKKTLKKKIKASLWQDFQDYGLGIDDGLGVNEVVFKVFLPDEVEA